MTVLHYDSSLGRQKRSSCEVFLQCRVLTGKYKLHTKHKEIITHSQPNQLLKHATLLPTYITLPLTLLHHYTLHLLLLSQTRGELDWLPVAGHTAPSVRYGCAHCIHRPLFVCRLTRRVSAGVVL